MSTLVNIGVFLLIVVSVFLVIVVLMQRAKSDGGGVAAMGGGIAEATFGADTGNVLSKVTIYLSIAFFVLAFLTGLGQINLSRGAKKSEGALPTLSAGPAPAPATTPAAPAPAETAPAPAK